MLQKLQNRLLNVFVLFINKGLKEACVAALLAGVWWAAMHSGTCIGALIKFEHAVMDMVGWHHY